VSNEPTGPSGMSAKSALRLEYSIIALGIVALLLIFQPFNITLFTIGAMIVVIAGLVNNLLPLAQPGVPVRSVITVAMVVAMIFCIVLLLAIISAWLYGTFFLDPPIPGSQSERIMAKATKWYAHPFTLSVAGIAVVLAGLIAMRGRSRP
jgi:hypothetical protein